MQIVEYTEAVDLTMHGMHDDIYVMQPMAISGMTMQEVRAAAEAGAVFAVMKQPQTKAEEKPEKEPEQKAEAKPTPPPKSPVGQGRLNSHSRNHGRQVYFNGNYQRCDSLCKKSCGLWSGRNWKIYVCQ